MAENTLRNNHSNIYAALSQFITKSFHTFIISFDPYQRYELLNPYFTEANGNKMLHLAPSGLSAL